MGPEPRFAGVEFRNALVLLGSVKAVPSVGMPDVTMAAVKEHAVALTDRIDALRRDHRLDVVIGDDARVRLLS